MQIQQAVQNLLASNQLLPTQVIQQLAAGQQLEAVVVKAALEGQLATIKLAETLLNIRAPVAVKEGEVVQIILSQTEGKPVVSITPAAPITIQPLANQLSSLIQGRQYLAEVIKVLAENKILVELKLPNSSVTQAKSQAIQVEIDVSRLNKLFSVADKVQLEVLSTKPLNVALSAEPLSREQAVVQRIQQLLTRPSTGSTVATLTAFNRGTTIQSLPAPVQTAIQDLLAAVTDKQQIKLPQVLKQAIQQSGTFSERQLLQQGKAIQSDFKANIARLITSIESSLQQYQKAMNTTTNIETRTTNTVTPSITENSSGVKKLHSPFAPKLPSMATNTTERSGPTEQGNQPAVTISQALRTEANKPAVTTTRTLHSPFAPAAKTELVKGNTVVTSANTPAVKTNSDNTKPVELVAQRLQTQTPTDTTGQARTTQVVPPLSALIQASVAGATSRAALLALTSPPTPLVANQTMPLTDSVLTSPHQALTLAKMLSQSISSDQVRGLQMNFLILQNLLREVESVQARVQLNQFSMLKEPDTSNAPVASWLVDVPLKDKHDVDLLQLQIDQHRGQEAEQDDHIWNVKLRLDTQNLGPLQATVTMYADNFKVILRAERVESAALIEQHLAVLQASLMALGIEVNSISCVCGEVAKATLSEQFLTETTHLVDISI